MSHNWKHIALKSTLGLLLAAVLVGAYILGSGKRGEAVCKKVEITIKDSLRTPFVTTESIRQYLKEDFGNIIGVKVDSLDLFRMESVLNSKSAILKSEVSVTNHGTVGIIITQRTPMVRFQTPAYGLYCDKDGVLLPLQEEFRTDVMIIDGNIPLSTEDCSSGRPKDPKDAKWLEDILKFATHIEHSIWKDRIAQIHCDKDGELTIIPKYGNERFLFGHPEDIEDKFNKMQTYYERILAEKGEEAYNVVDLRYRKQIVCKNTEKKKNK
jgi:cell division protein FtsQ